MKLGIEVLRDSALCERLKGKRIALLGHPASVTQDCVHSLDVLGKHPKLNLVAAFGPQHGMRGEKQDNMVESADYLDPDHGIPVYSLYGTTRRPAPAMLETFDTLLVDLQDVGCRVYTFATTLSYMLEACARAAKQVWILDRPNPAGRPIEGRILQDGWESFVGAGRTPMRHGLTLGELGRFYAAAAGLGVDLEVVAMEGYDPSAGPGFGWPQAELSWVNPSPNAHGLSMARCFPGTVLIEGTNLSEGRGTTRPLELFGAPELDVPAILDEMQRLAPHWLEGCRLRRCFFEPTFQKHTHRICQGIQIHVDGPSYEHLRFKPYRLVSLFLKALRRLDADFPIWREFDYEYETERLAIDCIDGGPGLREWVDDHDATPRDVDSLLRENELEWEETRRPFLLY